MLFKKKENHADDARMELTEHLGELRARIIRIILYIFGGAILTYNLFKPIYAFLFYPMEIIMRQHKAEGWSLRFTTFTEPFFVVLKIAIVAGMIIVAPLLILEVWGFISPALTKEEKKPIRYLAPLAVTLFISGVALAYWVAKYAIMWFASYVGWFPHAVLLQDPETFVMFMLKMMGVFGLVFELPIFLLFLAWIGILTSDMMIKSWKYAVLIITVIGVIVTPSNDLFTMTVMIFPVILLYLGSIWLVKLVEKYRKAHMP